MEKRREVEHLTAKRGKREFVTISENTWKETKEEKRGGP